MARPPSSSTRLDDAARAGWLYYIAGKTQDEVAAHMGISRQAAQRLVSLAVAERLVRVWMEHPIARCLELAEALSARYRLARAEVRERPALRDWDRLEAYLDSTPAPNGAGRARMLFLNNRNELLSDEVLDAAAEAPVALARETVRRALAQAGFHVERRPGFGRKRHMSVGVRP